MPGPQPSAIDPAVIDRIVRTIEGKEQISGNERDGFEVENWPELVRVVVNAYLLATAMPVKPGAAGD